MTTVDSNKPIRIAIVEDDPALRKMIVSLLQADPSYAVVAELAEGKAAIAALAHLAVDIALVDIGLPDISGIEVIRELKARTPDCNVLVVTTFGDEKTVTAALEAGADGYLLKGTALDELKRDLHALQHGGSPLSPMIARKLLNRLQAKAADETRESGGETRLTRREHEILQMIARLLLRRDLDDLRHQRRHRAQPSQAHLPQARGAFEDRGGLRGAATEFDSLSACSRWPLSRHGRAMRTNNHPPPQPSPTRGEGAAPSYCTVVPQLHRSPC